MSCIVDALSGLSALYIERRFGYDYVEVSDVTMETVTVANDNDLEVSYVENCTCDSNSNTAGVFDVFVERMGFQILFILSVTLQL